MKTARKDLVLSFVVGIMVAFLVFFLSADRGYALFHRLSDGCFAAGVLLCGMGGLFFCANKGVFNILGFSVAQAGKIITGYGKDPAETGHDAYYNYCMRQAEKEPKPFAHLLIGGGVYLAAATVFLVIYLMMG